MRNWISVHEYTPQPGYRIQTVALAGYITVDTEVQHFDFKEEEWKTRHMNYTVERPCFFKIREAVYDDETGLFFATDDGAAIEGVIGWTRDDFDSQKSKRLGLVDEVKFPDELKAKMMNMPKIFNLPKKTK